MRGGEGGGGRRGDVERLRGRQRLAPRALAQRLALYQLRCDDVRLAYLLDVVDGDDSRVVQGENGLRLLAEASDALLVAHEARGQNLQRDFARRPLVEREVDF